MGRGDKAAIKQEKKGKRRSTRDSVSPRHNTKSSPRVPSVAIEEVASVAEDSKSPRLVRLLNSISSGSPRKIRGGSPRSPKNSSGASPRQEQAGQEMQRAFSTGVVASSASMSPPSEPAPALPPPNAEDSAPLLGDQLELEEKSAGELLMEKYMAIEPPAVNFASQNVAFGGDSDQSASSATLAASRSKSVPFVPDEVVKKGQLKRKASHEQELDSGSDKKDTASAVVTEVDVALVHLPEFEYDYDTSYEGSRLQRAIQIAEAKIVASLMNSQAAEKPELAASGEGERGSSSGSPSAGRLVEELSEKARILEHQCRTLEHKWQEGEAQLAENKKVLVSVKNQLHMHKEALAIARTKAQEGATTVDMLKGELKKAVTAIRAQQDKLRQYEQRQAESLARTASTPATACS